MNLSRTSNKEIKVPGQVTVKVTWSDTFYRFNPSFKRGEIYKREYSSMGYANNFIKKYKKMGFIADHEIIIS